MRSIKYIFIPLMLITIVGMWGSTYFSQNLYEKQFYAISAFLTLLLGAIALFNDKYVNWVYRPKPEIIFKMERPYINVFRNKIYLRIGIKNKGHSTATACMCRLEKVIDLDTGQEVHKGFEKVLLPWVGYPYPVIENTALELYRVLDSKDWDYLINDYDWIKNDIPKDLDSLADFAIVDSIKQDSKIRLVTGIRWPTQFILAKNTYENIQLTIAIYGDNFDSKLIELKMNYADVLNKAKQLTASQV